jgi:hypothetical protein
VRSLEHFQKCLYGQEFHLRTVHSALDSTPARIKLYFPAPPRPEAQQCTDSHAEKNANTINISRHGASSCGCSCSRMRPSRRKEGSAERPRLGTYSTRSRGWTTPGMGRYRLPETHVKGLLGLMEVAGSERRHTGAPLGVRRRTVQNSSDSPPSV